MAEKKGEEEGVGRGGGGEGERGDVETMCSLPHSYTIHIIQFHQMSPKKI